MSKAAQPGTRTNLENRFANLYDFSLDIQRHEIDLEFVYYGGRIHYVFDENIFELFVRPFANSRYVARDASNVEGEEDADEPGSRTARQTALLCAEALFSGRLPGQAGGRIYLSEWHRWELLSRLNELMLDNADGFEPADEADYLTEKASVLNADVLPERPASSHDPHLAADISELRKIASVKATALLPFWRNRTLAAMIAANDTVEPLHQLKRLLSTEMQQRLHGLVSLRRPVGEELDRVTSDARTWTTALRQEVFARDIYFDTVTRRTKTSFENDGKTLAMLEWVSSRLGPRDRLVLVTGDAALYDAYRRAFEKDLKSRRLGDRPFLLRRPAQYAPLFTATVASAELDPHLKLFYSVQQAVEMPITPLRMASISATDLSREILARRNSLTLRPLKDGRLQGKAYIQEIWNRFGQDYDSDNIAYLEAELDKNERILNGFADDLLARRITPKEREILVNAAGGKHEDQRRAFVQYIEEVIEVLVASAVAMWTPIAKRFLHRALVTSLSKERRYVPVAINIAGREANSALDVVNFVIKSEDVSLAELAKTAENRFQPDTAFDVFISSSAVALIANDWRMAEHLSEVAINAFSYFASTENISPLEGQEAFYLCAVAKRFRLGLIPLDDIGSGYKTARRIFNQIGNLKGRASKEQKKAALSQPVIELRAEVEYAGACLFFSILCLGQSDRMAGVDSAHDIKESCIKAHQLAGEALDKCLRIYSSQDFGGYSPDLHGQGHQIVRAQFLINIAAWAALAPLVRKGSVGSFEHRNNLRAECARALPALEASLGAARTELFVAEVLAFKISEGVEVPESLERLRELAAASPTFELELDRIWFDSFVTHWVGA